MKEIRIAACTVPPTYFTDGYFNLMSGESKTIRVDYDPSLKLENLNISADGYNVEGIEVK